MLKGVFNERPPKPKYESVWKVDQVLTMFREDGGSASLSLQGLTIKKAMLLVLTRPCRGADLAALDLRNRSYVPEEVVFQSCHLSKQSRPSHQGTSFFFPSFEEDKRQCLVETLKVYEQRTALFRALRESSISFIYWQTWSCYLKYHCEMVKDMPAKSRD